MGTAGRDTIFKVDILKVEREIREPEMAQPGMLRVNGDGKCTGM
jgi:hypothetical protein